MAIDTTEASLFGMGRGSAQIWGQNRSLAMLQQQMQQDQLRRQKEDAEIADQVGKINYDAARTEDLPEILNRYGKIKNIFTQIRGTQNAMDRIKLQAQLNQEKAELSRGVNLSKQAARQLGDLGKLRLTNPDEISDDFTPKYKTLNSLSVFDPKFTTLAEETAATALVPKFDELATMKKIADASVKKIPQSDIKSQKVGGGTSYYREAGQLLDKDAFATNIASEVAKSKGMQNQVKRLYPDLPFVDAVKAYTDDRYNGMKGAYEEMKKTGASVVKPDNWMQKALFQDQLIRKRKADGITGGEDDTPATFWQNTINDAIDEKPNSGEFMFDSIAANVLEKGQNMDGRIKLNKNSNGTITVTVPKITKSDISATSSGKVENKITQIKPEKKFTYNPKDRLQSSKTLTDIINIYTGEKIPYSKQFTEGGKGKVAGGRGAKELQTNKPKASSNTLNFFKKK